MSRLLACLQMDNDSRGCYSEMNGNTFKKFKWIRSLLIPTCRAGSRNLLLTTKFTLVVKQVDCIQFENVYFNAVVIDFYIICNCTSITTQTLYSVVISSGCAESAMLFVWRRIVRRADYLIWGSAKVGEEDDFVSVGRTKPKKPQQRRIRGAWKRGVLLQAKILLLGCYGQLSK